MISAKSILHRKMKYTIRKILLLFFISVISVVLARTTSLTSSSTRGGAAAVAEQKIKNWQQYQHYKSLAQKIRHDEQDKLQLYKDTYREYQKRRLQQSPSIDNIEQYISYDQHTDTNYDRIKFEVEQQSTIYATIQRSLKEKYYIQWQLDQVKLQQHQQDVGSRLFPLQTTPHTITNSDQYPHYIHKSLHTNNNNKHHRKLEDAFENAYNTNRPGSTYGTNMFCGQTWAEASTSCESRQNCPSGQSSECIMPGHECWAFTECDTRYGHGEQFSEFHNVVGGSNLEASGIGASTSGGYVDLTTTSVDKTDHYFCGKSYDDAISKCASHCPTGNLNDCPSGEICFFNTPCDARMMTGAPSPPSPSFSPTTPAPVVHENKLNKYFCGYDWDDAQER